MTFSTPVQKFCDFYNSKNMNKKTFYQKNQANIIRPPKPLRSCKLSMDDLTSLMSRQGSEIKKRNSNGPIEILKLERSSFKKPKLNSNASMNNSIFASRSNSPIKFGLQKHEASFINKNKLRQYKFYYQIGFGGFGRVWKVYNKQQMKDEAMKELSKKKVIRKNNIESVMNERRILSSLRHPFLINMNSSFQDQNNLYLVMDYLRGGDLRYHICYKKGFSQKEIKFIIACIIVGLQYVHKMNIIHKDLKPQNIVFQENGYARITDFGIAKNLLLEGNTHNKHESSGTPVYMAPQILFKKQYSYQSDFYALGVMLHQLILKKRPFEGKNRGQIRDELLKRQIVLKEADLPFGYSASAADLVNKLLKRNPIQRIGYRGIDEIKEHKYFSDIKWKKLQKKEVKPPFIPHVISQMKEYLDQISLFNEMNQQNNQENCEPIDQATNSLFADYDYQKNRNQKESKKLKNNLKKGKRISQRKILV